MFWFLFFTKFYPWFFPSIFARKCVLVSSDLNCTVNGSTNDVQKTLKHKVLRVWVQGTCTSRLILRYITKKVCGSCPDFYFIRAFYFLQLKIKGNFSIALKIATVVSFNKARFLSTISRFIKKTCISTPPRPVSTLQVEKKPYTPVISAIGTNDNLPARSEWHLTFRTSWRKASSHRVTEGYELSSRLQEYALSAGMKSSAHSAQLHQARLSLSFRAHVKSSFQLLLPSCSVPAKYWT